MYFQSAFKRPEDTFRALFKPLLQHKMGNIMALHTSTSTKSHDKMLLKDFLVLHHSACKANCRRHLDFGEQKMWNHVFGLRITRTRYGSRCVPRDIVVVAFHHRRRKTRQICRIYWYVSLGWSHNMNMNMRMVGCQWLAPKIMTCR